VSVASGSDGGSSWIYVAVVVEGMCSELHVQCGACSGVNLSDLKSDVHVNNTCTQAMFTPATWPSLAATDPCAMRSEACEAREYRGVSFGCVDVVY
jgi:hypothetical protein